MNKASELPQRVYAKDGSYWHVRAEGEKRKWTKLCRIKEGLPAMYRALAKLTEERELDRSMARVIADWERDIASTHAAKTRRDEAARGKVIAQRLTEFTVDQVEPPDIVAFLKDYKAKPRTYNAYRGQLRDLMRYAEECGHRAAGTNPVDSVRTMSLKARTRYITDEELAAIKAAALSGKDGLDTRSGPMITALIDMAYLTGQRISDLLSLEWNQIGATGIEFAPAKVSGSTGVRVLVGWTADLRQVVERLRELKQGKSQSVFTTQDGMPYTYWGASTAWRRAVKRAGLKDCRFHDLRAKALTDVDGERGIIDAQAMGGHSTQNQTADYIRHKTARKVSATR